MITRIASQKRHLVASQRQESFLLFSYGDYFEPGNVRWGGLRFFNDDLLYPGGVFPLHYHEELEVVTIVLAGGIRQRQEGQASLRLRASTVQVLSAGTGIRHEEINEFPEQARLLQMGIFPRERGRIPCHVEAVMDRHPVNELMAVASGQNKAGAVPMNADATVFLGSLEAYQMINYEMMPDRNVFLYLTRGALTVNGVTFETGDQARIAKEPEFMLGAISHSEFVLVDVPTLSQTIRE